ncbi:MULTISPECIES: ABC-type transport auxiliary lipoprotein family protein [Comamonas]|nr:ABC-type transport auxiliary lipoprotein family protein [Comamonas terrae]
MVMQRTRLNAGAASRNAGVRGAARPLALAALLLALAGCSALPSPPAQSTRYDLGLVEAAPVSQAAVQLPPLVLADVQSPGLPEGLSSMYYRLAYANGQELRPYQHARWSQPPAQLVQQRLRARLGGQRALLGSQDSVSLPSQNLPVATLRVDVEEFSQVFDSATSSRGVVQLRASLIGAQTRIGNILLGQQVFTAQVPAGTADAAGGARALAAATDDALAQMNRWLQGLGH